MTKVVKFGGSSLASAKQFKKVKKIQKKYFKLVLYIFFAYGVEK